jgi:ABC-2 type transport system permease protein
MNRAVLKKCLQEARLLWAACAAAIFAFCWVRVYIVSRLEMSSFVSIVEKLWDKWKDFSPVPLSQLLSYSGRIALTFDEPIVVLCISVFAIARGSDAISGEINRGTMELLLAQPVSRLQALYSQATVTVTGLVLLALLSWCGVWCGVHTVTVKEDAPTNSLHIPGLPFEIPTKMPVATKVIQLPFLYVPIPVEFKEAEKIRVPMYQRVNMDDIIPGAFNLGCFGFCLAGMSTMVSAFDRYRWRTIGLVTGFYVLQMVCKILGMAIKEVGWLRQLTIFTPYEPQKFIAAAVHTPQDAWSIALYDSAGSFLEPGPLGYNLILLGLGLGCYVVAGIVFHKRDLPAPL